RGNVYRAAKSDGGPVERARAVECRTVACPYQSMLSAGGQPAQRKSETLWVQGHNCHRIRMSASRWPLCATIWGVDDPCLPLQGNPRGDLDPLRTLDPDDPADLRRASSHRCRKRGGRGTG